MKKGNPALLFAVLALLFIALPDDAGAAGTRRPKLRPDEFGNVLIDNFSEQYKIEPVIFPHWLHRARFTCRLCHVDVGFAMRAGETGIKEEDIRNGLYCGACHNGKMAFGPHEPKLFRDRQNCERCHAAGKEVRYKNDFYEFQKSMPRARFGNRIDWLQAEEQGLLTLQDHLPGISFDAQKIKLQEDFELSAQVPEMPDIIFSHKKHAVWNGCQLCHPDLFGVKKGSQPYSMQEIFQGKYCGACHDLVAFPNLECQKCHTKTVQ